MLTFMFLVVYLFTGHVLIDLFNLSHILVSDSTTAVMYEHVSVDESDCKQQLRPSQCESGSKRLKMNC